LIGADMNERYKDLVKFPEDPAAKVLSRANIILKTPLEAPANATAEVVLEELEAKDAMIDLLRLLPALLPPRERVWWACLAARDYVGPKSDKDPPPLVAAEAWVFDPTDENRTVASTAMDHALVDDDTVHCAVAALYADGTLGPGDLAQHPAPAGASETAAFAMNMVALAEHSDTFEEHGRMLIDRALDIARGGSGRLESADTREEV